MWWITTTLSLMAVVMIGVIIWLSGWRPSKPNISIPSMRINWFKWGCLSVVLILLFGMGSCVGCSIMFTKKLIDHPPTMTQQKGVIYATTPATITADYEFNIESNAPVQMKLPGIQKPVIYDPEKGFQQFPAPSPGPKVFTDPRDPVNGHVAFRLYPVHNKK